MRGTSWPDERELATWKALLAVSTILDHRIDQQLRHDGGLSRQQYDVLSRLADSTDGELRMAVLADVAHTSKSGLTYQVTQLEKAGLVHRCTAVDDDRGVVARITEAGLAKLRAVAPGHADLVRHLLLDSLTDAEFDGLHTGLDILARRLGAPAL
ncbi:MarR family winged helix-turn-helix transcriptional regulator [Actinacidiphila acididurans]|uniref:MarR family transcriptional regulator n=1 Tax=Actinacidiphila acididurans TaxID=2784346 RepID=A0ABS2TL69_9ACTN|nr:MarR family transcriptional regulator [Actinacidiphila acididurans]MBM9503817.1 MarR family transcriptional regulator [Actinacidiphila acididurans]